MTELYFTNPKIGKLMAKTTKVYRTHYFLNRIHYIRAYKVAVSPVFVLFVKFMYGEKLVESNHPAFYRRNNIIFLGQT